MHCSYAILCIAVFAILQMSQDISHMSELGVPSLSWIGPMDSKVKSVTAEVTVQGTWATSTSQCNSPVMFVLSFLAESARAAGRKP